MISRFRNVETKFVEKPDQNFSDKVDTLGRKLKQGAAEYITKIEDDPALALQEFYKTPELYYLLNKEKQREIREKLRTQAATAAPDVQRIMAARAVRFGWPEIIAELGSAIETPEIVGAINSILLGEALIIPDAQVRTLLLQV